MDKKHWIANVSKKQPVANEVIVDVLHRDGTVSENNTAGLWSKTNIGDRSNWWLQAGDDSSSIIAWRLHEKVNSVIKKEDTDKQQEFLDWLKEQDMYSSLDSAVVMQRMLEVWLKSADNNPELVVVDRSSLVEWWDVLEDAVNTPQYYQLQCVKAVVNQVSKFIKDK